MLVILLLNSTTSLSWALPNREKFALWPATIGAAALGLGSSAQGIFILIFGSGDLHYSVASSPVAAFNALRDLEVGIESCFNGAIQMAAILYDDISGSSMIQQVSIVLSTIAVAYGMMKFHARFCDGLWTKGLEALVFSFFLVDFIFNTATIGLLVTSLYFFAAAYLFIVAAMLGVTFGMKYNFCNSLRKTLSSLLTVSPIFAFHFERYEVESPRTTLAVILLRYLGNACIAILLGILRLIGKNSQILLISCLACYPVLFYLVFFHASSYIQAAHLIQIRPGTSSMNYESVDRDELLKLCASIRVFPFGGEVTRIILYTKINRQKGKYPNRVLNGICVPHGYAKAEKLLKLFNSTDSENRRLKKTNLRFLRAEHPEDPGIRGLIDDILEEDPKSYETLNELGHWYMERKEWDLAEAAYARSIDANPPCAKVAVNNTALLISYRTQLQTPVSQSSQEPIASNSPAGV